MKKFHLFIYLFAGLILFQGCDPGTSANDSGEITASEERQFIWNGLNFWYYWQKSVPELADERKEDIPSFNQLLKGPSSDEELFDRLILDEDKNSWFIENYEEHEAAQLGTSKSFGFRFGLIEERGVTGLGTGNVFGYVQYIMPDSPADAAGLKRGDVFRGINGENITLNNYENLLDNDTYNLSMATVRRTENWYQIDDLDETVLVQSEIINENPIHTSEMYYFGAKTVGYLLYNSFRFNYHEELNERFAEFKENNVDELVLDLRYNGGGALITSALLASMISGVDANSTFAELRYNDKRSSVAPEPFTFYEKVPIYDQSGSFLNADSDVNSLGLSRVYILASGRTASASETLINGLRPYGVEVIVIGTETFGKDEGSITVYDVPSAMYSPSNSQDRSKINPNHKLAMQPIVFKIFNADGEDYPDGFPPSPGTTVQHEINYLEGGLPPLGHPEEQLFKTALGKINGSFFAKDIADDGVDLSMHFMDSSELIPFHDDVYLLPSDLDRISIDKK